MCILALDSSGTPREWISYDDAISYHATDSVVWSLGDVVAKYRGGFKEDGTQSYIESTSIIAIKGRRFDLLKSGTVALTNKTLFGRDRNICAYCGTQHANYSKLSRDHIVPKFLGGLNVWQNVVTACKACNSRKGHKTLKESKMSLLYVPYEPNHWEHLLLQQRNILADQMEYLMAGIPKHSRILLN